MEKNDTSFYIPYIIEDEGAFGTLHITLADVKHLKFGHKTCLVYMVPNYSEQVYRDCLREIWKDLAAKARETRCLIPNEQGGFVRCKKNCNGCPNLRSGLLYSLDVATEINEEFDIEDTSASEDFEIADLRMLLEDLFKRLRQIKPRYADILERLYAGCSHEEIAIETGKRESTIQEQAALALALARKILAGKQ